MLLRSKRTGTKGLRKNHGRCLVAFQHFLDAPRWYVVLLDQLPKAKMDGRSAPAFFKRKAERILMSLAEESGEDSLITDLVHLAMISVAAGE